MRANFFKQNLKSFLLIPFMAVGFMITLHARDAITLTVDDSNAANNIYSFDISGAEVDDLIYYRFSDGYHMTKVMALENEFALIPHAIVERQFKISGSVRVIAYVAKKGGTLDRAINSETIQIGNSCEGCSLPNIEMSSPTSNIHLSTSWNAFFTSGVGGEIPGLTEDISMPISETPSDLPWFFVNLTLQNNNVELSGKHLEFYFPDDTYEIAGVIINDEWISFFPLTDSYSTNNSLSPEITYHSDDLEDDFIRFHLSEEIEDQANFYIILKGEPNSEFDEYNFTGALFNKRGKRYPIDKYRLSVTPTTQPHDPNDIFSPIYGPCLDDDITYKVNFQNLGDGPARDVKVIVDIDDDYIDPFTLTAITSSHSAFLDSDYHIEDGKITFLFDDIFLPGTNQVDPATSYNETMGWVEFQVSLLDCIIDSDPNGLDTLHTTGEIVFYGQLGFEQYTPFNELMQKPCALPCPGLGFNSEAETEMSSLRIASSGFSTQLPFTVNIYPTIINDYLTIESSLLEIGVPLEINFVDIAGRTWENKSISSEREMIYKEELDISHLPKGVYFIQIKHGNELINKKVVKN